MRITNPGFLQTTTLAPAGICAPDLVKPFGQLGEDPVTVRIFVPDLQVMVLDGALAPGLLLGVEVGFGVAVGFL